MGLLTGQQWPKLKPHSGPVVTADASRFSESYWYVTSSPDTQFFICVICPLFCVAGMVIS